jgi:DNA helicase IV
MKVWQVISEQRGKGESKEEIRELFDNELFYHCVNGTLHKYFNADVKSKMDNICERLCHELFIDDDYEDPWEKCDSACCEVCLDKFLESEVDND